MPDARREIFVLMPHRIYKQLQSHRKLKFAICLLGLSVLWLVALPWIARQPRMAAHLQWLEDQGIDGGAMYYTELEAMKPILEKLERRR